MAFLRDDAVNRTLQLTEKWNSQGNLRMSGHTDHTKLAQRLAKFGQQQVYTFYEKLTPSQKDELDRQVASIDWALVQTLVETVVEHPQPFAVPANVEPAPYFPHVPTDLAMGEKYRLARQRGEELLRQGKVAAFVVAGGQGTRLGWEGPKGTFPATPIKRKPLFQCFAEFLRALGQRAENPIPFYIMTSTMNHGTTVEFWKVHNYFGLTQDQVMFFSQDMLPAVGFDGRVLLETDHTLALSPNGHGGSLLALHKSGALADMARRGIEQISYFQVDNPIVRCVDPLFIGLHDLEKADMSSKMLPKAAPREKLGNLCLVDGKFSIIEYSDLPDHLAEARLPDGSLKFLAGSIALHAIRVDFVQRLNATGFALPYHRAEKKVPCIDLTTGQTVKPEKPNAVKMETFVFDALPLTERSIVYQTDRIDEFAPIKQPSGVDSPDSAREIMTQRNIGWLEAAGISVPKKPDGQPDCTVEMAASFAIYPEDVAEKKSRICPIQPGADVYLN